MKQINVVKNGQGIKKIHRSDMREINGISKHKDRMHPDERKKTNNEGRPNPAQSPIPK
jgi:hypothetical protein